MHVFQRLCPPLIETPRLRLRTFTHNDIVTLHAAVKESSSELQPFLPWCHPEYNLTDAEDWVRFTQETWTQRRQYAFAVECKHSGRFVGGCGLDSPSTVERRTWVTGFEHPKRDKDMQPKRLDILPTQACKFWVWHQLNLSCRSKTKPVNKSPFGVAQST